MHYDIFNGDADGIIALLQLRWDQPLDSKLITGVKRDVSLVERIIHAQDISSLTVLDISLDKNRTSLIHLLEKNIPTFYCDHHRAQDIPQSDCLTTLINTDAQVCTSLLINQKLRGKYEYWAIAAAYGDNLYERAEAICEKLAVTLEQREFLKSLGTLINYNGYGATLDDLLFHPAELFHKLYTYSDPFKLFAEPNSAYWQLKAGFEQDWQHAQTVKPEFESARLAVFTLPNTPWARRISGSLSNHLANQHPDRAHLVLTLNPNEKDYAVSLRAPLSNRTGADEICSQFETGGGRKAAAGINKLPVKLKNQLTETTSAYYA